MFLKLIKEFGIKKNVKNKWRNYSLQTTLGKLNTFGIIVDYDDISKANLLREELVKRGVPYNQITLLSYKPDFKEQAVGDELIYGLRDFSVFGDVNSEKIDRFVTTSFDVLISFYDDYNYPLLLVTLLSKAKFKIGLAEDCSKANQLTIKTNKDNYVTFVDETFKYLKILNKN